MQQAAGRLARVVAAVRWSDLSTPLVNDAEANTISLAHEVPASLVRQLPSSVLWEETVQTMGRMGVATFVEIGPGAVLTGLIRRILPEAKLLNVNDPKSLNATLAAVS